jgi:hypothetical protein
MDIRNSGGARPLFSKSTKSSALVHRGELSEPLPSPGPTGDGGMGHHEDCADHQSRMPHECALFPR